MHGAASWSNQFVWYAESPWWHAEHASGLRCHRNSWNAAAWSAAAWNAASWNATCIANFDPTAPSSWNEAAWYLCKCSTYWYILAGCSKHAISPIKRTICPSRHHPAISKYPNGLPIVSANSQGSGTFTYSGATHICGECTSSSCDELSTHAQCRRITIFTNAAVLEHEWVCTPPLHDAKGKR